MDEDDEADEVPPVRLHPALLASCALTFARDLADAVSEFCGITAHMFAAHYVHGAHQREMHDQALLEIETLTQGE